jgi:hypothetical protein
MPKDKSVISIPSTSKIVVFPNVAANFSTAIYNEGIYITKSSILATYPKSVVRIYKNPSNPKKIYFAAKDTSLLESFVFDLVNKGQTKDSNPDSFRESSTSYFWDRAGSESSYRDFSSFSQPRNLEIEQSQVLNKSINLYSIPLVSQQVSYMSSLNTDTEINNLFLQYGMFLKAKSSISDYESYDLYSSNKATTNTAETSGSWINRVGLYEKFLFNQLTSSSDIESDLKTIQPLYEKDLQLDKSVKILNVNKITFSDFVSNNFDKQFMFVTEGSAFFNEGKTWSGSGYYSNIGVQVQTPNYVTFLYNGEDDQKQNFYLLTKGSIFAINEIVNGTETSNEYSFDQVFGNSLVALKKQNSAVNTITDFEIFNVSNNTKQFRYYDSDFDRSDYYEGQIEKENNKIFNLNKKLNSLEDYVTLYRTSVDGLSNFIIDKEETNPNYARTSVYLFKDSFNYSDYGFIPTDISETIYEFEIDQELDIQNGTFVVAEIN